LNGPVQYPPYLGDDLAGLDAYQALVALPTRYSTPPGNIQDAKNAKREKRKGFLCVFLASLASWRFIPPLSATGLAPSGTIAAANADGS
jgi:hypothetical protein